MNWKAKAFIQNIISLLPSEMSYEAYYMLQRRFGSLRNFNPVSRITSTISLVKFLRSTGCEIHNKVFFELGTGRIPLAPLSLWLMGAGKTITLDINPYVRHELVRDSLHHISENKQEIINLFSDLLIIERLESLIEYYLSGDFTLDEFFKFCSIEYLAPCDATKTSIPSGSVDYFLSWAVFEHISYEILRDIICEANRFIASQGVFANHIDYHDHFSTSDKKITSINFLKFTDTEWKKYAGNRYMYMNRLRHDDYINLFKSCGHIIILEDTVTDQRSLELLKSSNFKLDKKFLKKDPEITAIKNATIISKSVTIR